MDQERKNSNSEGDKGSVLTTPSSEKSTHGTVKGAWGEQDTNEVDIGRAFDQFEELRRELSRPMRVPTSRSGRKSTKGEPDEEEGEYHNDSTFIDLQEYLQRHHQDAEASGITPKKIGVRFRNLTVQGFGSGRMYLPTFADEMLGLFGKGVFDFFKSLLPQKHLPTKNIISGFSGVVKPGEMLLVLGSPGSGSSTFLRALTNQRRDFTAIHGDVDYSGLDFELARKQYRGEILFNDEVDIHLATLTVGQTLRFALKTKTPHRRIPGTSRKVFVEQMLELFAKMFGMKHVLNTIVGNEWTRGVSGGERKRVSIMEALASRATINAFDNSTRGLDSSTAVDYIRSLRILTSISKATTIVTLYQAGEQIYHEFDKVCLIDSGRQIFYGKASEACSYFEALGFEFPQGSTTADYLTSITDPLERRIKPGFEEKAPSTPEQLEAAFRASKYWDLVQKELLEYDREMDGYAADFSKAVKEDKSKITRIKSPFTVSFPMQVWYLAQRELQLQWQDQTGLRSRAINSIVLALITGSLFYQIPRTPAGAFAIGGALFFNEVIVGWLQLLEAINMTMGRAITAKQTAFAFYRPSAQILAKTIADIPLLVIQCSLFTVVLYFMAGLAADAGKFFLQLLYIITITICMTAVYRAIGAFSRNLDQVVRYALLVLNVVVLFAGYMQTQGNMKSWVYRWIFYASPVAYVHEALMINQFDGVDFTCTPDSLIPGVPNADITNQVCFMVGSEPHSNTVSGTRYIIEQFGYLPSHLWRNYAILWVFTLGYIAIAMIGVEYMPFGSGGAAVKVFLKPEKPLFRASKTENAESGNSPSTIGQKLPRDQESSGSALTAKTTDHNQHSIFTWRNVVYTIPNGISDLTLLNNVSGFVKPGRLTALMGPSGAGKTTLLNALSQRLRVGVVTGEMFLDGKPLPPGFKRNTAYVEQMDIHDSTATVREALRFSAELRQPANVPMHEKYALVEEVIRLLGLESLADAVIGQPGFGLSVEERKRVTIGVELAAKPDILIFLDEPTSGLDSMGALSLVRFLRKLADESQLAILCTIHQPSALLFRNFDDLLLLASGGNEVYFGPIGQNGKTVVQYFERNGAQLMPDSANPAEYILETIRPRQGFDWPATWRNSPEAELAFNEIRRIEEARSAIPATLNAETSSEYSLPLYAQIQVVTRRLWKHYWRDSSYGYSKIFSNLSMALISGLLLFNLGNTVLEMQSRGFAAFMVEILSPLLVTSIEAKFLSLRMLYEARERNIYSASAFITAMILCEIPYAILGTVFFFLPWYYMIGFSHGSAAAGYQFFLVLLFEIFLAPFGMMIASICRDMTMISIVNPFIFVVTNGFTGILVPYSSLPRFYSSWVYWVNPLTWVIRGLMGNGVHGVKVECAEKEFAIFQPPENQTCGEYAGEWLKSAMGTIVNMDSTSDCRYCAFKDGDEYLSTVNIEYATHWRDLGIFAVYIFSSAALVYIFHWATREFQWKRFFRRFWHKILA